MEKKYYNDVESFQNNLKLQFSPKTKMVFYGIQFIDSQVHMEKTLERIGEMIQRKKNKKYLA